MVEMHCHDTYKKKKKIVIDFCFLFFVRSGMFVLRHRFLLYLGMITLFVQFLLDLRYAKFFLTCSY